MGSQIPPKTGSRWTTRRVARVARLGGAWLALAIGGCGGGAANTPTPQATVRSFATALNEARFADAYALMSAEYRDRVSYEQFEKQLNEDRRETMDIGHALSRTQTQVQQEAVLRYGDQNELRLRQESGRWLLADNPIALYDQSTPRAALAAFVNAMERRRYDIVMRLVPKADKEGVTAERMEESWRGEGREEVERMLENLRSHLQDPIEVIGSHATMPYGDRLRVEFVLEDGAWKIADPE
jgi:hypothetical protein